MLHLVNKIDGKSKLVSSWSAKPLDFLIGATKTPYTDQWKHKCIALEAGESFTFAEIKGPAIITRLYFAFTFLMRPVALRGLELQFYWDGEEDPSVLTPLGDFFGSSFCRYIEYDSLAQSMQNGGYVSRLPMPFRKSARLVIKNSTNFKVDQIFFGTTYLTQKSLPANTMYFHAHWRRSNPTQAGIPHTLIDIKGSGHYAGCHIYHQNIDHWPLRRPTQWLLPGGFGMGHLEGWEEIHVDGEKNPSQHGTGTEEFFNTGPYFTHGRSTGILEGCTRRSYFTGRLSCYRFNVFDPIPFAKSFKMIWRHGMLDAVRSDFASTVFWYQGKSHAILTLPAYEARKPRSVIPHVLWATLFTPIIWIVKWAARRIGAP